MARLPRQGSHAAFSRWPLSDRRLRAVAGQTTEDAGAHPHQAADHRLSGNSRKYRAHRSDPRRVETEDRRPIRNEGDRTGGRVVLAGIDLAHALSFKIEIPRLLGSNHRTCVAYLFVWIAGACR